MNVKKTSFIILLALCSCQPDQKRWHENIGLERPSLGQVVFEVTSKNIAHKGTCVAEREFILLRKKTLFINAVNNLFSMLIDGKSEEKMNSIVKLIQSERSDEYTLWAADLIEKLVKEIIKPNLPLIKKILDKNEPNIDLVNKPVLIELVANIVHDADFEKLIHDLATKPITSLTDAAAFVVQVMPIFERNLDSINKLKFAQENEQKFFIFMNNIFALAQAALVMPPMIETWQKSDAPKPDLLFKVQDRVKNPEILMGRFLYAAIQEPQLAQFVTSFRDNFSIKNSDLIPALDFVQTTLIGIDDSSELRSLILKAVSMTKKSLLNPEVKLALSNFYEITLKIDSLNQAKLTAQTAPKITIGQIRELIQTFKTHMSVFEYFLNNPKLAKNAATLGTTWFGKALGKTFLDVEVEVPEFVKKVIEDEKLFYDLVGNSKILLNAGMLDDIIEFTDLLIRYKYITDDDSIFAGKDSALAKRNPIEDALAEFNKYRAQLNKAFQLDKMDVELVKPVVASARKLFPQNKPFLDSPVVIVGDTFLQVFSSNEQTQCVTEVEPLTYADQIEKLSDELVTFMRDRENGLMSVFPIIRNNVPTPVE